MDDKDFLKLCRQKDDAGYQDIKDYIDNKGKFKTIRGIKGTSALHIAARNNNIKIVELLLDNGMSPMLKDKTKLEKNPIIDAIETNSIDTFKILIKSSKIKAPKTKKRYSEFAALGLNKEINNSDFETYIKLLVKSNFDINILDRNSKTILLKSIEQQNIQRVNISLKYASVDSTERIPLRFAISRAEDNNDIIKTIIKAGAELNIKSVTEWGDGFNALHECHLYSNIEIFGFLIEEHNMIDTLDDDTLSEIVSHNEIEYLKYLWEIPKVNDYIIKNNLEEAFPQDVRDVFVF